MPGGSLRVGWIGTSRVTRARGGGGGGGGGAVFGFLRCKFLFLE